MNSSAVSRKSMIRTTMLPLPVAPHGRWRPEDTDVDEAERERIISMLDYLEYKVRCNMEREKAAANVSIELVPEYIPATFVQVEGSHAGRVARMFTIFPYRDATWIVTMLFVIGSITFTINAVLGLLPIVAPELVFDTLSTRALPYTIIIGAVLFLSGGILGTISGWNADRGTIKALEGGDPAIPQGKTDRVPDVYRPALLGSAAWVWIPSGADLARVLSTVPFRAGISQFGAGLVLSVAAVAGFPGVLDPEANFELFALLVFWPQVIGGFVFFAANLTLVIFVQDRWYKPKPSSSDWHASGWNTLGGMGFAVAGTLLVLGANNAAAWMAAYGSVTFLIGSLISWFSIMEFHPTRWAT